MTEPLTIVRWCSYDEAAALPSVIGGHIDNATPEHMNVLVDTIRAQGLKFTGTRYQHQCVPVFSDGATLLCSMRVWGGIMSEVWGGSYVDWAWMNPEEVLPEGVKGGPYS